MQDHLLLLFVVLVFVTVFLVSQLIIIPTMGTSARESKKIRKRLGEMARDRPERTISLVRQKYLRRLLPFEQWMDRLPGMESLDLLIEQSGRMFPAYRFLLGSLVLGLAVGLGAWLILHQFLVAVVLAAAAVFLPALKISLDRTARLEKFEAQLPEALDIMTRALKSGNPFNVALSYAAREIESPLGEEFGIICDEINYGRDLSEAFHYLLLRVPSTSLMAMSTAILIQRETGGNLSEVLDKISRLLRERFRFNREVRVLTAEGRVSAWVLSLMPLLIFGLISWMNPNYYKQMISSPEGQRLLGLGILLLLLGIVWISRLVRIEV
jgi:tight adherence protein B